MSGLLPKPELTAIISLFYVVAAYNMTKQYTDVIF